VEKMKSVIKKKNLTGDEKGATLIIALILLLIGGLISAALLGHMGSGIRASQVYERRTAELYAADAGVEDAIWKIQHGETPVCPGDPYWSYNITDVNGKELQISIEYLPNEGIYKITSIAITDGIGSGVAAINSTTAVEANVSVLYLDFSSLLDNAIVSYDTIDIQPNNLVDGDVWLPDEDNLEIHDPSAITGEVKDEDKVELTWPTTEQLSAYCYDDVEGTYDPGLFVDVKYTDIIGPCYRDGDLIVDNTGDPDTLVLEGTVYVAGDLEFWQSGTSHNYIVDLNGHTIFADGSIDFPSNVVGISGPGCIIAVGDILFQPSIVGDDFVLVMSIEGIVNFQPSGDFTGCIAGNVDVNLQPGNTISWISPEGKGLDFPMGSETGDKLPPIDIMNIESWEIIQQ
jgi:hypothetical protein